MSQRYKMQFFIEDNPDKSREDDYEGFYLEKGDLVYGGREYFTDGNKFTWYFYAVDEDSALMFLYFGDDVLDEFVDSLDEYNIDGAKNAFPRLMKALENGANDTYHRSALIRLESPESGVESFWCLATLVENIDFSDLETDYIGKKLKILLDDAVEIINEVQNNEVSTWDQLTGGFRAFMGGYRKASLLSHVIDFFS